jgi:hypothetical protein
VGTNNALGRRLYDYSQAKIEIAYGCFGNATLMRMLWRPKASGASCQQQVFGEFFQEHPINFSEYPGAALFGSTEVHIAVANCMTAHGYIEDSSDRRCQPGSI